MSHIGISQIERAHSEEAPNRKLRRKRRRQRLLVAQHLVASLKRKPKSETQCILHIRLFQQLLCIWEALLCERSVVNVVCLDLGSFTHLRRLSVRHGRNAEVGLARAAPEQRRVL